MENGPGHLANVPVSYRVHNIVPCLFYQFTFTGLSCNKPKLPTGVTVRGRSYLYQDQLTYICPGGKKQGLITCQANGQWSDPPICDKI